MNPIHDKQSPRDAAVQERPEVARWWREYDYHLSRQGVNAKARPWYQRRVRQLLEQHPGVRAAALTGPDIDAYFTALGGMSMAQWQLLQAVDAIERFAHYAKMPWCDQVNWQEWRQRWNTAASAEEAAALEHGLLPTDPSLRRFVLRLRLRHRSLRTEQSYVQWVERCAHFHALHQVGDLTPRHIGPFLSYLVGERRVSGSTQRQALCALVDFMHEGLGISEVDVGDYRPSSSPRQVPTVLSKDEVRRLLAAVQEPAPSLLIALLYGAGLRISEALRLRIKDIDLDNRLQLLRDFAPTALRASPLALSDLAFRSFAAARISASLRDCMPRPALGARPHLAREAPVVVLLCPRYVVKRW